MDRTTDGQTRVSTLGLPAVPFRDADVVVVVTPMRVSRLESPVLRSYWRRADLPDDECDLLEPNMLGR